MQDILTILLLTAMFFIPLMIAAAFGIPGFRSRPRPSGPRISTAGVWKVVKRNGKYYDRETNEELKVMTLKELMETKYE